MKAYSNHQRGFTLIEMLIGVFIAAVGIIGVLQLQKVFIQASSQANARTIAMQLVDQQFNIFRSTNSLNSILSASDKANPIIKNIDSFERSWTAIPRYYHQLNNNWQNSSVGIIPSPLEPDAKNITVTVAWFDINNERHEVSQTQMLAKVSLQDSASVTANLQPADKPIIVQSSVIPLPNPIINLVAYSIASANKLANPSKIVSSLVLAKNSKKQPPVTKIKTVIFNNENEIIELIDFATVKCSCQLQPGLATGMTPTMITIVDDKLVSDPTSAQNITKETAKTTAKTSDTNQNYLCQKCCKDHHDSSAVKSKYVAMSSDNHPHYLDGFSPKINNGSYVEACRFRRIDGIYRLVPDWVLVKLIIMPSQYLTNPVTKLNYKNYIKAAIKAHLKQQPLTQILAGRDITQINIAQGHLTVRGLYVDRASLSTKDLAQVITAINNNNPHWLGLIPFYELDLSSKVSWQSSNQAVAIIKLNTQAKDPKPKLEIKSNGTSVISATINQGNLGLTNSNLSKSNGYINDSITVAIN